MSYPLAEGLAKGGFEALLVIAESSRDPDLAPFVGAVHLGSCFVLAPPTGPPFLGFFTAMEREEAAATECRLLTPEDLEVESLRQQSLAEGALLAAVLTRALAVAEVRPGRLALAGRTSAGTVVDACGELARRGWSFADGRGLTRLYRKRKNGAEKRLARRAADGTCAAFRRVVAQLAAARAEGGYLSLAGERLTVGRLRAEISQELARFGLEQPAGNIVAAGRDAGVPHSTGHDEDAIPVAASLVVDLFPKGGVFADCTRTFCVGAVPPALASAHAAVLDALRDAHAAARPGSRGWDLQMRACDRLEAAGHPTPRSRPGTEEGYVHGLGHGVGYEIHELPSFGRQAEAGEGAIESGDLLTLEPGLYYPDHADGGFGVRLEDLVLVTDAGAENLTPLPYDLDPRAW